MHLLWVRGRSLVSWSSGFSLKDMDSLTSTIIFTLSWSPWQRIGYGWPPRPTGTFWRSTFMIPRVPRAEEGFCWMTPRFTYLRICFMLCACCSTLWLEMMPFFLWSLKIKLLKISDFFSDFFEYWWATWISLNWGRYLNKILLTTFCFEAIANPRQMVGVSTSKKYFCYIQS